MSQITVTSLRDDPDAAKCPRCWHFHRVKDNFDHLCDRCCQIILEYFPNHESVAGIKAAYEAQRQRYLKKDTAA